MNCDEILTFHSLLEDIYAKADKTGVELRPKLDFMRQPFDNIEKFKTDIQAQYYIDLFINEQRKDLILKNVPNVKLDSKSNVTAYQCLKQNIEWIVETQEKTLKNDCFFTNGRIKPDARGLLGYYGLNQGYLNWRHAAANKTHLQKILNAVDTMKLEYDTFHNNFKKRLNIINAKKAEIEDLISQAHKYFNYFVRPNSSKSIYNLREIASTIMAIEFKLRELSLQINNMASTELYLYNRRRKDWIEFLIVRKTSLPEMPLPKFEMHRPRIELHYYKR